MDKIINSKVDHQSIYEIYRACRLCGAGAGYKMPIIQNVVDIDGCDIELKQKIRECIQIEVHQDDKMPPLICELCVDKVNDFYEFFDMCRQTNKQTRMRLGLPLQSTLKISSDSSDCILGVTEPLYQNEDSNEPLSKSSSNRKFRSAQSKMPELQVRITTDTNLDMKSKQFKIKSTKKDHRQRKHDQRETRNSKDTSDKRDTRLSKDSERRETRHTRESEKRDTRLTRANDHKESDRRETRAKDSRERNLKDMRDRKESKDINKAVKRETRDKSSSPLPVRSTRSSLEMNSKSVKMEPKKPAQKTTQPPPPKSILKKEKKVEEESPTSKSKRSREPSKPEVPEKKVKLTVTVKSPPVKATTHRCEVCRTVCKTSQALISHIKGHMVTFTSEKLACNSCEDWFVSSEQATAHHKEHKTRGDPYRCKGCPETFDTHTELNSHVEKDKCFPWAELPDMKCTECWRYFATTRLIVEHRCLGEDDRPGGKCSKCDRPYALLKNLLKHEPTCTKRKPGYIDPEWLKKVRPLQIKVARCDKLLASTVNSRRRYDVGNVAENYGLDRKCRYPYLKLKFNRMVNIQTELEDFYSEEDYIHWDSENSDEDNVIVEKKTRVETLYRLALKTLFSQRCLGRVPRKKRKLKLDKNVFDDTINNTFDSDLSKNIDNIIDNLGDDDESKPTIDKNTSEDVSSINKSVESSKDNDESVKFDLGDKSDNASVNSETLLDNVDDAYNRFNDNRDNVFNDAVEDMNKITENKNSKLEDDKVQNNIESSTKTNKDLKDDSNNDKHINETNLVKDTEQNGDKTEINKSSKTSTETETSVVKDNFNGTECLQETHNMDKPKEQCDLEMDDDKLMDAINEHIGDNSDEKTKVDIKNNIVSENNCKDNKDTVKSKSYLDPSETKSVHLDNISDDNFD